MFSTIIHPLQSLFYSHPCMSLCLTSIMWSHLTLVQPSHQLMSNHHKTCRALPLRSSSWCSLPQITCQFACPTPFSASSSQQNYLLRLRAAWTCAHCSTVRKQYAGRTLGWSWGSLLSYTNHCLLRKKNSFCIYFVQF